MGLVFALQILLVPAALSNGSSDERVQPRSDKTGKGHPVGLRVAEACERALAEPRIEMPKGAEACEG